MNKFLSKAKCKTFEWVVLQLPKQPFIVAIRPKKRLVWQEQKTKNSYILPKESGIYALYAMAGSTQLYIGEAGDLKQRIQYHFSDSPSSNKNSTLKKKLRKMGYPLQTPLREAFRIRLLLLAFGRKEVEASLHLKHFPKTSRKQAAKKSNKK